MKAIVIDDSRAIRGIIGQMLKDLGYEVSDAANGKLAFESLKTSGALDLAMVDWNMPEMNGFELLCALRADKSFDSMKIVMVTTETEMAQMAKALQAGANEYIMKPFTPEVINEKVNDAGIGESRLIMWRPI